MRMASRSLVWVTIFQQGALDVAYGAAVAMTDKPQVSFVYQGQRSECRQQSSEGFYSTSVYYALLCCTNRLLMIHWEAERIKYLGRDPNCQFPPPIGLYSCRDHAEHM